MRPPMGDRPAQEKHSIFQLTRLGEAEIPDLEELRTWGKSLHSWV
ncbi:MAG: hypothetical protein AB4426_20600 [Xenococcaceae cyanobacterium]